MGLFDGFRRSKEPRQPAVNQVQSEAVQNLSAAAQSESDGASIEGQPGLLDDEKSTERDQLSAEAAETSKFVEQEGQEPVAAQDAQGAEGQEPVVDEEDGLEDDGGHTEAASPYVIKRTPLKSLAEKEASDHVVEHTRIIAIINQKGGVGKSTTAINLAAALGELGKSVLVLDLDPQGNTTSGLGVDKGQVNCDIYDVLLGGQGIEDAVVADVCKCLDLVPATINLAGAEVELVNEMARESKLKGALGPLIGRYDYLFIDCPPALGLLTVNALVASDALLIPIQCEFYALEGVTKLLDSMKRVKTALNPSLEIFGVLLTMYDSRTVLSKQVAHEVRNFFGDAVFESVIPRTVRLSEAPSFGQPITEYDPTGRGAQAYLALAKEVINRG